MRPGHLIILHPITFFKGRIIDNFLAIIQFRFGNDMFYSKINFLCTFYVLIYLKFSPFIA